MQEKYIVLGCIVLCVIIGFIVKVIRIKKYDNRLKFTNDYQNDFITLMNGILEQKGINNELHFKLTKQVNKMQEELGEDGILTDIIDPLKQVHYKNYQVLINFLANYTQDLMVGGDIMMQRIITEAKGCDDAFIRHIGRLEDAIERTGKSLLNPFSCFSEGIRWIIGIPVNILYWCGIISSYTQRRYEHNIIKVVVDKIIVLIGLIGSIATLVLGWEELKDIVCSWIK